MQRLMLEHQQILSAIACGAHTFQAIVQACEGLYPLEVRSLVYALLQEGHLLQVNGAYYLAHDQRHQLSSRCVSLVPQEPDLPEPHPHDFDWRFDSSTVRQMASLVMQSSTPSHTALLLGTPSLFVELIYAQNTPYTVLLDWNALLIRTLQQHHVPDQFQPLCHDVLSGQLWQETREMDLAVMDPPWYPEHYAAFLAQASAVTRIGAQLFVVLLPTHTRPEGSTDRWEIFETAHTLGFALKSLQPGLVRYQTPPFEQASLAAEALEVEDGWRRGDLATFEKVMHPRHQVISSVMRAAVVRAGKRDAWAEVLLAGKKIKLRGPFTDNHVAPVLVSIERDDTLPTVSRRYKGRASIDLWLWNNQVFAVRGKAAFLVALSVLANQKIAEHFHLVPRKHVEEAMALLLCNTKIGDLQTQSVWKGGRSCDYTDTVTASGDRSRHRTESPTTPT